MAHKVTYAALTATAVIAAVDYQLRLVEDMFSPNAYPIIIGVLAVLSIVVNAWRDWQARQGH